uniref:Inositol polyphosphate-related phosphatase domain-containing protein n=1 Tax=Trichuris muris TaxID=70415 RepID=A0A5S6QBG6_TRIMR
MCIPHRSLRHSFEKCRPLWDSAQDALSEHWSLFSGPGVDVRAIWFAMSHALACPSAAMPRVALEKKEAARVEERIYRQLAGQPIGQSFWRTGVEQHPLSSTMEDVQYARMVFISANISFLAKESDECVESWTNAVAKEISDQKPVFAAVHLQGLHRVENDSAFLDSLTRALYRHKDLTMFDAVREIYDLDSLGICSVYFVSSAAKPMLFDYKNRSYKPVDGNYTDSHLRSPNIDHERLGKVDDDPVGFMMTRWMLFDKPFDFVNLVLNGERSLLDSCTKWPSEGGEARQKFLNQILNKMETYIHEDAMIFAGYFNLSIDLSRLIKDQLFMHKAVIQENNRNNVINAFDLSNRKLFTINDNEFNFYENHNWLFGTCNGQLIRKYDTEMKHYVGDRLFEPNVFFPPTDFYVPNSSEVENNYALHFSTTNSPGWRSRIVMNDRLRDRIQHDSFSSSSLYYGLVGEFEYISQSKPVTLIATIWLK